MFVLYSILPYIAITALFQLKYNLVTKITNGAVITNIFFVVLWDFCIEYITRQYLCCSASIFGAYTTADVAEAPVPPMSSCTETVPFYIDMGQQRWFVCIRLYCPCFFLLSASSLYFRFVARPPLIWRSCLLISSIFFTCLYNTGFSFFSLSLTSLCTVLLEIPKFFAAERTVARFSIMYCPSVTALCAGCSFNPTTPFSSYSADSK